jgi:hypothetical protein
MSKITDYTALTNVQSDDLLVCVDVHDSTQSPQGTTKKMTFSQLAGAELFKYYNTSSGTVANNAVITGLSYEVTANSLNAGSSFQVTLISAGATPFSNNADFYLDTTAGTKGTSIVLGSGHTLTYVLATFVCVTAGSSGTIVVNNSQSGAATLTVDTTANFYLELFNSYGANHTFTDYAMIATSI